jgi:acetate kinase
VIRARIREELGFLGIALDDARNAADAAVISTPTSGFVVRVRPMNEELMVFRRRGRAHGIPVTSDIGRS